jgi:hypothetical protein
LNLANAQWVEQLNQWIQVRSSPANDFRRPIRICTRFSTTITTNATICIKLIGFFAVTIPKR